MTPCYKTTTVDLNEVTYVQNIDLEIKFPQPILHYKLVYAINIEFITANELGEFIQAINKECGKFTDIVLENVSEHYFEIVVTGKRYRLNRGKKSYLVITNDFYSDNYIFNVCTYPEDYFLTHFIKLNELFKAKEEINYESESKGDTLHDVTYSLGIFPSLENLKHHRFRGQSGEYAYVDEGNGVTFNKYVWDDTRHNWFKATC